MDLLKQGFQTIANIQMQESYQPSKSGHNNLEDLLVAYTSAASSQPAQRQTSNEQGLPHSVITSVALNTNMPINPSIQRSYFTSTTM